MVTLNNYSALTLIKKEKNKNKRGKDQNKLWDETNMQKFPYVHGVRVSDKVGFLG